MATDCSGAGPSVITPSSTTASRLQEVCSWAARPSCTDGTGNRTNATSCAGIILRVVPRTVPRGRQPKPAAVTERMGRPRCSGAATEHSPTRQSVSTSIRAIDQVAALPNRAVLDQRAPLRGARSGAPRARAPALTAPLGAPAPTQPSGGYDPAGLSGSFRYSTSGEPKQPHNGGHTAPGSTRARNAWARFSAERRRTTFRFQAWRNPSSQMMCRRCAVLPPADASRWLSLLLSARVAQWS